MSEHDVDSVSWIQKLRHILLHEPQSQQELVELLRDAHDRTLIDGDTLGMLEGVIQFAQLRARDIMHPKNTMVSLSVNDSFDKIVDIVTHSGHSRFPILADNQEDIIGILHAKDLIRFQSNGELAFDMYDLVRPATFVPESKRLDKLLSEFKSMRNHMAMVVDEYGNVCGFITIEDIIEQIIGDIEDEFDIEEEENISFHNPHFMVLKGSTPLDEFNTALQAELSSSFDTIAGLINERFGYLPRRGEVLVIDDFEFKILRADARRIWLLSCFDKRSKHHNKNTQGTPHG